MVQALHRVQSLHPPHSLRLNSIKVPLTVLFREYGVVGRNLRSFFSHSLHDTQSLPADRKLSLGVRGDSPYSGQLRRTEQLMETTHSNGYRQKRWKEGVPPTSGTLSNPTGDTSLSDPFRTDDLTRLPLPSPPDYT